MQLGGIMVDSVISTNDEKTDREKFKEEFRKSAAFHLIS